MSLISLMPLEVKIGITLIAIVSFILLWIRFAKKSDIGNSAANIIITTGICCTFIGISYGLYSFDVEHIENNLGALIDGIKTAFIPSAFAIFIALIWKFFETITISLRSKNQEGISGATIDDLMQKQIEQINLLNAIFNQKDSLLFENFDSIRKEVVMGFRDMKNSFEGFAQKVADNNIEALKKVMEDFNTKINEQFGENFKHLNEAVGKLLEWQDRYGQELDKKIAFFQNLQDQLSKQAQDYDLIVKNSQNFEQSASNLAELIKTNNQQQNHLASTLEQLSKLCATLSQDIPDTMRQVENISKASQEFFQKVRENEERLTNYFNAFHKQAMDAMHKNEENLTELHKKIAYTMHENEQILIGKFNSMHEKITHTMTENIAGISEKIGNQSEALQRNLEVALNDSLRTLGQQLATLSTKFVDDYTPLTEQLRRIVEISKSIK